MADHATTRRMADAPLGGVRPEQLADEKSRAGIDRGLEALWHLLTSMKFALVLILAIAGLALIGSIVVQAPQGVLTSAEAKSEWLAEVRPKYGGWTGLMDQLQLFTIFQSIWFKVLAAALAISVLACSVHRIPGLWKTATNPHIDVGDALFEHAPQHEVMVSRQAPAQALEQVQAVLRKHHYRTLIADDGTVHVYGDRFRWAPFGTLIGHLSLVVIMAGALIGSTLGYRDNGFLIPEGSTVAVPTKDGLSIKLEAFRDSYYAETGAPSDYASEVVLYQGGSEVARHTVRVNDPLRYEDISFYQAFYGPSAAMKVTDASGTELYAEGVPLAWSSTDGARRVGMFTLPEKGVTVWVVGTAGPSDPLIKPGQMRVELFEAEGDAKPITQATIDQGKASEVGGLTFTFEREGQFTGLTLAKDPGTPVVWLGALMLVAGFVIVFMFPHRRIWGRLGARPNGGSSFALAAIGRRDVGFTTEFEKLVTDIRQAFQTSQRS